MSNGPTPPEYRIGSWETSEGWNQIEAGMTGIKKGYDDLQGATHKQKLNYISIATEDLKHAISDQTRYSGDVAADAICELWYRMGIAIGALLRLFQQALGPAIKRLMTMPEERKPEPVRIEPIQKASAAGGVTIRKILGTILTSK